jgi:hypothetical protein
MARTFLRSLRNPSQPRVSTTLFQSDAIAKQQKSSSSYFHQPVYRFLNGTTMSAPYLLLSDASHSVQFDNPVLRRQPSLKQKRVGSLFLRKIEGNTFVAAKNKHCGVGSTSE